MVLMRNRSVLPFTCGALALSLGILALLGWLTRTAILLRVGESTQAIVASSGVCLSLSGLALMGLAWHSASSPRTRAALQLVGAVVLTLSSAMLAEILLDVDLHVDLPTLHQWLHDGNPHPGRMAPNTALAFFLVGLSLWIEAWHGERPWSARLSRLLAMVVGLLGLFGLMVHLLRPDLLFSWHSIILRAAPYTGIGLLLLGLGFATRWHARTGLPGDFTGNHDPGRSIFKAAALGLSVVALITGAAGFSLQLNSVNDKAQEHLSRTLSDRRLVLEEALASALQKAQLLGNDPAITVRLSALATGGTASEASPSSMAHLTEGWLQHGFSYVAFEDHNGVLASVGTPMGTPALDVPLHGRTSQAPQASLAWRDGFVVRHRQTIRDARGTIGHLFTEQPLHVMALLAAELQGWGDSYDLALCTSGGDHIVCFPQRQSPQGFKAPKLMKGQPLPMVLALNGQTGVTMRLDFRQHQVVAAYTPVSDTGLGMVFKVDTDELYASARHQVLLALPVIVLIVLAGLWVLRLQLQPMVRELLLTRQVARANEARFVAAMESSLDAFYILKAERDATGQIFDFRFTYVTARGASLVSLTPAQVEGRLLCELLPINRSAGFFDKFKQVVETGAPLSEEFAIRDPSVRATWLSHQVVKLGTDSLAITSRDVSARKNDEEARRESEDRLRMVTDSVPALIAYLDMNEHYLFINQSGAELYEYPADEIVGKTVLEVVGPLSYADMKPHLDTVAAGYPVVFERQLTRTDGSVRRLLCNYFPHYDDRGATTHVCVLAHDITPRKQMEEALALSQDRLKAVTDNMPALISYIDRDHCFRFANLAYKTWMGWEPDSLINRSLRDIYGDEAYLRITPYLTQALAGQTQRYERELDSVTGPRHASVTMTPHRNSNGEVVGLYVLVNDITQLKQAERLLATSQERLSLSMDGSHLALFDWNLQTNQVYLSAHWSTMLGGPPAEVTLSLPALSALVHPDDQATVQAKISAVLKGSTPFYNVEHRVRMRSGEWLWILSRGRVVERDAAGRALRLSGTNADISEQKSLEAQLQHLAEIDALTNLPNRALFNDRLQRALSRVRRNGTHMALMLLDVDHFKAINDGLGHDAGDAVLMEFSRRLVNTVRETDTVARLGGDEFTIILEDLHHADEAEMIAVKVVGAMTDDFRHADQVMRVTTSIGVAYVDQPGEDATALVKRADMALYRAKAAGRNGYHCARPMA